MPAESRNDPQLAAFLQQAETRQIPHATLIGLLTSQGWSEKEAYAALATHCRARGLEIPTRLAPTASARDAFFYLLLFATLATWTIALANLAFTLIDRWLGDPLFTPYAESATSYELTFSLAALIVAFPIYLLISRAILTESAAHPEKLQSSVRKWLTYLALVAAACVFMGDLITALAYLLRGEITSHFLGKAFIVFLLSGGVFTYYFGGLRRTAAQTPDAPSRDRLMAALAAAAVILTVALGFFNLGSPHLQRDYRADIQRTRDLTNLDLLIRNSYNAHNKQLPASLDHLDGNQPTHDPITGTPYEYHPQQGSAFELCATFLHPTQPGPTQVRSALTHPAGHHCFSFDATATNPYPFSPPD